MEKLGKIRRLYYRDGLTVAEIVRRTGLARNTVKSWLKAAEGTAPKYRRRSTGARRPKTPRSRPTWRN
jgi:transposase